VAEETATGLLYRTGGAFKAMTDDRVSQSVNHAQVEQGRQAREEFERTSELACVIRHFEQTAEFLELLGACHALVATTNRVIPDAGAALGDVCWLSVRQGGGKPSSWGELSPKWGPCLETQVLRQRVHGPYVRLHCAARPLLSRRGRLSYAQCFTTSRWKSDVAPNPPSHVSILRTTPRVELPRMSVSIAFGSCSISKVGACICLSRSHNGRRK
jgi:hypothetical protein